MCTEGAARKVIGVEGARGLITIMDGAWNAYASGSRVRRPASRAMLVWEDMIDGAREHFAEWEHVRFTSGFNETMVMCEYLEVRFKKHDQALLTQNIPTQTQIMAASQGHFPGMEGLHLLSSGYVLNRAEASIEKYVVVRRVAGRLEWWIDLEELAAGETNPGTPILSGLPDGDLPSLPTIRPVHRTKEGDV